MNKAKFIGKTFGRNQFGYHSIELEYEYRGHRYFVYDYGIGVDCPLWKQHKEEQGKIDRYIEDENKPANPENNADIGLDMFFKSVEI